MRLLIQRVSQGRVDVDGVAHAHIGAGFVVLAGFSGVDVDPQLSPPAVRTRMIERMAEKMIGLRVFSDAQGKMNLDLAAVGGELLVISQFTLYADCVKGRRPSFHLAAPGEAAQAAYNELLRVLKALLPGRIQSGVFGANMDIHLTNQGPITITLDSDSLFSL